MEHFRQLMGRIGTGVDAVGVLVIVIGTILATGRFLLLQTQPQMDARLDSPYHIYRQSVGRANLLGLEFLVAGNIIRTVVVAPTIENVAILGGGLC